MTYLKNEFRYYSCEDQLVMVRKQTFPQPQTEAKLLTNCLRNAVLTGDAKQESK